MAGAARPKRHSWVKVKLHCYVCKHCATCYENKQDRTGGWYRTWSLPDRSKVNALNTPPCAPGPATARRLVHYASAIACYGRAPRDTSPDPEEAGAH